MSDARKQVFDILHWHTNTDRANPAADAILAALPDIVRGMVKPLVWDKVGSESKASALGGLYLVADCYEEGFAFWCPHECTEEEPVHGYHGCEDAAKQAAHGHHIAQVLAGLDI